MGGLKLPIAEAAAHPCTTAAGYDFPNAISKEEAAQKSWQNDDQDQFNHSLHLGSCVQRRNEFSLRDPLARYRTAGGKEGPSSGF